MADIEYSGAAVPLSERILIHIERAIPGARYGVRAFNTRLCSAFSVLTDNERTIGGRLRDDMVDAGLRVTGENPLLLTTQPGISSGLRIDSSPGSYITPVTVGVEPTPKQIRLTLPLGASGGTWTMTFDFGHGAETTSGISATAIAASLVSAIEALATPVPGDVTVFLEHPGDSLIGRSYLITIGGTLSGFDWDVSASGSGLLGVAQIQTSRTQSAGGSSHALQACWADYDSGYADPSSTLQCRLRFSRGGLSSSWVTKITAAGAMTPNNTAAGAMAVKAAVQAAAEEVCGAGQVTAVLYFRATGQMVVTLSWVNPGAQTLVGLEVQDYSTVSGASLVTFATESQTLRVNSANQDEFVLIDANPGFMSGVPDSYTATFGGVTRTFYRNEDSPSYLTTQWTALASGSTVHANSFGTGSVEKAGMLYFVQFSGANTNTNVAAVVVDSDGTPVFEYAWVVSQGSPYVNDIHRFVILADSGTFTVSSDGTNFSTALTVGLSAATFLSDLMIMPAIGFGNCTVSGAGTLANPFMIEYIGALALTPMPLLTSTLESLIGGADPAAWTITEPVAGNSQVDQLWIDPNASGGFLRATSQGDFSGNIPWNASAATVETALNFIDSVDAWGLTVSGPDGGPYLLTWTKWGLAPVLTLSQDTLTVLVSSLLRLEWLQEAQGPAIWRCPENWDPPQVPGTGDTAILRYGTVKIIEGLRQECSWTRSADLLALGGGDFVVGQVVRLQKSAGGTFPTATISGTSHTLSADTNYTIIGIDRFAQVCQIALSLSGVAVVLTSAGTGTFRIGVLLAEYQQYGTFTGDVGLSERFLNRNEERPRFLTIGASQVDLGLGAVGAGSALQNLDLGAQLASVRQYKSGTSRLTGEMATTLRVKNAASSLHLLGGYCAVSPSDPETDSSVLGAVEVRNASLLLGQVVIGSYNGSGDVLRSPQGFACGGTITHN